MLRSPLTSSPLSAISTTVATKTEIDMTFSDRCVSLVKQFEGYSATAYKCPAGVWTIGYGTTSGVSPGDRVTATEADALLRQELSEAAECVEDLVNPALTQNAFDALCSFVYNVGRGAFAGSTMLKHINAARMAAAANEFDRWVFAKGKRLKGLEVRRAAEKRLFTDTKGAGV